MTNAANNTTTADFGFDMYGCRRNQDHYSSTRSSNPNYAYGVNLSGMSHGDRSAPRFIEWIERHGLGTAVHHPTNKDYNDGRCWSCIDIFTNDYESLKKILNSCNGFDFYSDRIEELYPNG